MSHTSMNKCFVLIPGMISGASGECDFKGLSWSWPESEEATMRVSSHGHTRLLSPMHTTKQQTVNIT